MAESKHALTAEEIAANVAADHLRRQEQAAKFAGRRDLTADPSEGVQVGGPMVSIQAYPHAGLTGIGERNKHILDTLKPGEPIVIFRAKDILSLMVLQEYSRLVEMYANTDLQEAVVRKINEFREWQQANPQFIRLPD